MRRSTAAAVLSLVLLCAAVVPAADAPVLPAPEGPLPVGRTRWLVTDPKRTDPFDARRRRIEVVAWYPAAAGGTSPAPYFVSGASEVRSFASRFGNPSLFDDLLSTSTHAAADAPPREGRDRLPLLLFSYGFTSVPSSSTALLEELASHGYVVLSIGHPYESTATTLADGAVVTMLGNDGKIRPQIQQVFAEWETEDAVLAKVTSAASDAERRQLLHAYLAGFTHTHEALRRWVDDARAVIAQLPSPPRGSAIAKVIARADTSRFGVAGHSMGGVMAGELCLMETRCAAGLNLDGSPQSGALIDGSLGRPFLMAYSARPGRTGANDVIYRRAASRYYRVDVAGTQHLDFTDMTLWPPLRERKAVGPIEPAQAIRATRAIVREFFDQELRGRASALLSGERALPGVDVIAPAK